MIGWVEKTLEAGTVGVRCRRSGLLEALLVPTVRVHELCQPPGPDDSALVSGLCATVHC